MTSHDKWFSTWQNNIWTNEFIARITNQCNERCQHCCFRSGPKCVGQLSIPDCKQLNMWLPSHIRINIMGGEFTILPDYPDILFALTSSRQKAAIVTNGQWGDNTRATHIFLSSVDKICDVCDKVSVTISGDRWHQNPSWRPQLLYREHDPKANLICGPDIPKTKLLPLGRAYDNKLVSKTSELHCCCCREVSSLAIVETGMITLCPLGYFPWKHFSEISYYDAREYVWRWRAKQLDLGMDCFSCMERDDENHSVWG